MEFTPQPVIVSVPLQWLPAHLAERVVPVGRPGPPRDAGAYVLYWARTAVRAHENPALDVALTVANALGISAFVYHALSERYPYASDRHHMFMLEGARDLAAELTARGIGTAFHLERDGHRGPHLKTLAERAALVVTELMPVAPLSAWTAALADAIETPVWQVDTACVVPMSLTAQSYDRAFVYRDATRTLRHDRVLRPWTEVDVTQPAGVPSLPFTPVDLSSADFSQLLAQCRIDHAVGPVADTCGGSVAGYERWNQFRNGGGLEGYDRTRNDPTRMNGVSRMSAYLHYGMVSPFRLAREAAALKGAGAEKWLDELLIWRELAYTFCHHRADHDRTTALPTWALDTLAAHETDPRVLYDWERLARGTTDDAFWNAMQHSLLAHGELHNNVRMTWGKSIVEWTADAIRALAVLTDLNHRYALDGRDPASFGGILWCLGQFDRPFTPPNHILGAVRGRTTTAQAARVNVDAYVRVVRRLVYPQLTRVAVVGAGLAGLMCARTLADHHVQVTVFEKSRGVGGRCATRRAGVWRFDHGAQYFTLRDARLTPYTRSWQEQGLIAPWAGAVVVRDAGTWKGATDTVRRWVAVPGMSALGGHLAEGLDVSLGTTVQRIQRDGKQWRLLSDTGADLGVFDVVLTAVPSPQAHALLESVSPELARNTSAAVMHPTWATMLVFAERPDVSWDGAFINDDAVLAWISRDASKPGRAEHETWVLHASRTWSAAHVEDDAASVSGVMLDAMQRLLATTAAPVHCVAHRWRYALPDPVAADAALYDAKFGLGAGGDWCGGPRIEGALLSGVALAGRVLTHAHTQTAHTNTAI